MTEDEARHWVREHFGVSRETAVATFLDRMIAESHRQNLISAATMNEVWQRHVVDSAQLLLLAPPPQPGALWADIGTGAGFPGMVVALLSDHRVRMIEPRRRRADFLAEAANELGLAERAEVLCARAETVADPANVISARAVATLPDLLQSAHAMSTEKTLWLLPKGAKAREEVAAARRTWHGSFHVEPSLTQPGSLIVVATGVRRR